MLNHARPTATQETKQLHSSFSQKCFSKRRTSLVRRQLVEKSAFSLGLLFDKQKRQKQLERVAKHRLLARTFEETYEVASFHVKTKPLLQVRSLKHLEKIQPKKQLELHLPLIPRVAPVQPFNPPAYLRIKRSI